MCSASSPILCYTLTHLLNSVRTWLREFPRSVPVILKSHYTILYFRIRIYSTFVY